MTVQVDKILHYEQQPDTGAAGEWYDRVFGVASNDSGGSPSYHDWERTIPEITAQVIAAAKASGATVILPGNIYNFGDQPGVLEQGDAVQADRARRNGGILPCLARMRQDAADLPAGLVDGRQPAPLLRVQTGLPQQFRNAGDAMHHVAQLMLQNVQVVDRRMGRRNGGRFLPHFESPLGTAKPARSQSVPAGARGAPNGIHSSATAGAIQ